MFGKKDVFDQLFGADAARARVEFAPDLAVARPTMVAPEREDVALGEERRGQLAPFQYRVDDGEKFAGGFGPTQLLVADYWTLRARSVELFERNLYARGLIRRLVTNVINVGLHLESMPDEEMLGYPEEGLADWSEKTETRFELWGNEPRVFDAQERMTFGAMQAQAYRTALIAGDVLVTLQQDQRTKLPRVKLISGAAVRTPIEGLGGKLANGNKISHGVEIDAVGRHVAFWVLQDDGTSKRVPAYGEKSGRRLAWLVYGSDKLLDDVRGKPILSLVLQSLKEIDRYRDAIQRKAVINAILAMYIQKDVAKPGTKGMAANATRRGTKTAVDTDGTPRKFATAEHIPGLVLDELQVGEEPKAFQANGTTEAFGVFEEAIVQAFAWGNEVPPEILRLAFSSSYSASQAASIEFRIFLNKEQTFFGDSFCQPIYTDWLISATLAEKVTAPGLLEAWRDISRFDMFSAWTSSDWAGQIKPTIDPIKTIKSMDDGCRAGIFTRARATREVSGMKFRKVVAQLKRENEQLAAANEPLAKLEAMTKPQPEPPPAGADGKAKPPSKPAKSASASLDDVQVIEDLDLEADAVNNEATVN